MSNATGAPVTTAPELYHTSDGLQPLYIWKTVASHDLHIRFSTSILDHCPTVHCSICPKWAGRALSRSHLSPRAHQRLHRHAPSCPHTNHMLCFCRRLTTEVRSALFGQRNGEHRHRTLRHERCGVHHMLPIGLLNEETVWSCYSLPCERVCLFIIIIIINIG